VSHDRELLNSRDRNVEIRNVGMVDVGLFKYGGNFDSYREQRAIEKAALERAVEGKRRELEAREALARSSLEKNVKIHARSGRIMSDGSIKSARDLHTMHVEKKTAKNVTKARERQETAKSRTLELESEMDSSKGIYFRFADRKFDHRNLVRIEKLCFSLGTRVIFEDFSISLAGGERIAVDGRNGSGKTTLLKIIAGKIRDFSGIVTVNSSNVAYLDQNLDFLENSRTILENMQLNNQTLSGEDSRNILAKFLFRTHRVFEPLDSLSGGEKLRVALACLFAREEIPELILLDEPTNAMDMETMEILENILNQYHGAILVVSHDTVFKKNIGIVRSVELDGFSSGHQLD
jgi:ATPase subunit of ABC transporter with duplicated ATPase domains